jgi:hypothetical protein
VSGDLDGDEEAATGERGESAEALERVAGYDA